MNTKAFVVCSCSLLFALAPATSAADSQAEQALRAADEQWTKAAGANDLDKTVAFYSADAVVLPPNAPALTSKNTIREMWKGLLESVSIS